MENVTALPDALTRQKSPSRNLPYVEQTISGKTITFYLDGLDEPDTAWIEDVVDSRGYSLVDNNPNKLETKAFTAMQQNEDYNQYIISLFFDECESLEVDRRLSQIAD